MDIKQISAMRAHCDQLCAGGKELTISWEGGNDEGWLTMELDGKEIISPSDIEQKIIDTVENMLGYGSFAGDFSTSGKVSYDRDQKCFTGEDTYSESVGDTRDCQIDLFIPGDIWFDRLMLRFESDGNIVNCIIDLVILNGPYPAHADKILEEIEKQVAKSIMLITDGIDNFDGVWDNLNLDRASFEASDGLLKYQITQFYYSFNEDEYKEILVPLDEQLPSCS